MRIRKDGTLGPLFINRKQVVPLREWLAAECHPTKGYFVRAGWHCTSRPRAPHLSPKGRVWCKVKIEDFDTYLRPQKQGGLWFVAKRMKVLGTIPWCFSCERNVVKYVDHLCEDCHRAALDFA